MLTEGIFEYIKTVLFNSIFTTKFALEIIMAVVFIQLVIHRILGFILGTYLTNLLGTPNGAFQFQFKWIAIRPGYDHNEIVIHQFIWKNPPRFKETDYFVMVKQLVIRFDIVSVINAIRYGQDIVLHYVEIDSIDVFIEKGKGSEGLNLWAALGADCEDDESSVKSSVMNSMASAVAATASATSDALDLVVKYNPAAALYRTIKSTSSKLNRKTSKKSSSKKAVNGTSGEGSGNEESDHHHRHGRESMSGVDQDGIGSSDDDDDEDDPEVDSDDDSASHHVPSTIGATTTTNGEKSATTTSTSTPTAAAGDDTTNPPSEHWGVPYKLKAELFTLRSLHVFAEDFLSAKHTNAAKSLSHALKVELMNMTEKELTEKPKKGSKQRQGLYLDDLVWRLIAKLISELLASNKVALSTILASAAANQTTAAVVGTVTSVARGAVEELYTFNPKALLHGASYLSSAAIHAMDAKVNIINTRMLCPARVRASI